MSNNTELISFKYRLNDQNNEEISISIRVLKASQGKIFRGTISLILGGFIGTDNTDCRIIVGSKGYSKNTLRELSQDENSIIKELRNSGWDVIIFENMQYCKVDDKFKQNEYWIDEYCDWLIENYTKNNKKIYVIGYSSGAYIVGLHLKHLTEKKVEVDKIPKYGIFCFSVDVGNRFNKTDFSPDDFRSPTLFLSGKSIFDNKKIFPYVDGFNNTKLLYDYALGSNKSTEHKFIELNVGHNIFSLKDNQSEVKIVNIINQWFT